MNTTLTEVLLKSCVSPALLADRFAMEYAMLIAILHAHVGTEIGKLPHSNVHIVACDL